MIDLDDKRREQLLSGLDQTQLSDVAQAVNRYPSIEMEFKVQDADEIQVGDTVHVAITFEREMEEGDKLGPVYAPFYPGITYFDFIYISVSFLRFILRKSLFVGEKVEGWWAVIGDVEKNQLLAIKRVNVAKPQVLEDIEFEAPEEGSLYIIITLLFSLKYFF